MSRARLARRLRQRARGERACVSHSVDDSQRRQPDRRIPHAARPGRARSWPGTAAPPGQLVGALEHMREKASVEQSTPPTCARRTNAVVLALTGAAGALVAGRPTCATTTRSDFGGVTTGAPRRRLHVAPGLRLRALAGTTFRAPSFNDLYLPGLRRADAAARARQEHRVRPALAAASDGDAAATVYRNRVSDLIGYESDRSFCPADPAYAFGCARNVNQRPPAGRDAVAGRTRCRRAGRCARSSTSSTRRTTHRRAPGRVAPRTRRRCGADWRGGAWTAGASVLDCRRAARRRQGARPPRPRWT